MPHAHPGSYMGKEVGKYHCSLYFKYSKTIFVSFKKIWKAYVHIDNDVYFERAIYQSEILCIVGYSRKTKKTDRI